MEQRPRTQHWFEMKKFPKKILAPIVRMAPMSEINKMVPVLWVPKRFKMKKFPEKILMMQTIWSQKRKS